MSDEEKSKPPPGEAARLDLRGVPCPLSWAKTKVRLAELQPGEALTVWLDDPKGVRDLPRAAEAEGYAVDQPTAADGAWLIRIAI
jgi:TusA-related sulfurtransferase